MAVAQSAKSDSLFDVGVNLYNAGKYQEAIPLFEASDKLDKAEIDSTSNRRDYSASWLASCYYQMKEYDKARDINPNFFTLPPVDRRQTIQSDKVAEKATRCSAENKYAEALKYYKECAELEKASLGDKNYFYANTLFNTYINLRNMNDSVEIDSYYNQASKLYKELLGENNYVYYLLTLYEGYRQLSITKSLNIGNIERIITYFLTSYKIAGDISWCYSNISEREKQEQAYILAFLYQKLGNKYNGDKRLILHTLSNSYLSEVERYNKELDNIRSLYKISSYDYNFPDDIFEIIAIHKLHSDFTMRNDTCKIWKRYKHKYDVFCTRSNDTYNNIDLKQFVTISDSAFVEFYPHIIERWLSYKNNGKNSYNNVVELGILPDSVFINAMSEKINQNSYIDAWYIIDELHNASSVRSDEYLTFCNALYSYIWNKTYRKSNMEDLENRYYVRFEKIDSCNSIIKSLYNEWFNEEDLINVEKYFGQRNCNYRLKVLQRSVDNILKHKYEEAKRESTIILKDCIADYGDNHPLIGYAYKALGLSNLYLGNIVEAEKNLRESLSIFYKCINYKSIPPSIEYLNNSTMNYFRNSTSGEISVQDRGRTEYINTASLLKAILRNTEEWQQVIDLNKEIINIVNADTLLIDSEFDIPEIYQEMCMLSYQSRRNGYTKGKMEEYVSTFNRISKKNVMDLFKREIAQKRNDLYEEMNVIKPFSNDISYNLVFDKVYYKRWFEEDLQNICYWFPIESLIKEAYDAVLFSKGIILNTDIEIKKLILESNNQELISAFEELQNIREKMQDANKIQNKKELESRANEIEDQLIQGCKEYGDYTENMAINWQQVCSKLSTFDVAIEFMSFPIEGKDSIMYVAYVLKKGMRCPKMIPLFDEKQLQKGEGLYKNTLVSKLVWEPLAKYLEGVQNVYFAPSGELYNIGIEYLPHWSGEGRMSGKWNMYRLSSTRQLAVIKDKNALKQAFVYGGVKYDTKEDLLVADSRKYHSQERSFNYELFAIADSLNLRAGASYLPATKTEAEEIDKTLEQKKIMTKLLIDTLATEGFVWQENKPAAYCNTRILLDGKRSKIQRQS